ncbi:DUF222 domain-containing protein [Brachybacterium sp. DNPG3]
MDERRRQATDDGEHGTAPRSTALRALIEELTPALRAATGPVGERQEHADLLIALQDLRCALEALDIRALVALGDATREQEMRRAQEDAGPGGRPPAEEAVHRAADEITARDASLIQRRSAAHASKALESARRIQETLPEIHAGLAASRISPTAVQAISEHTAVLDDDQRREVSALLAQDLDALDAAGNRRWQGEAQTAVEKVDPEGSAERARRAAEKRCVGSVRKPHGMAMLYAMLPASQAAAIVKRLSVAAAQKVAASDDRQRAHGPVMADLLAATLLGEEAESAGAQGIREEDRVAAGGTSIDIGIVITDRALFAPDTGEAAHIEGYGAVPASAVREQVRAALLAPAPGQGDPAGSDGPALRVLFRRLYTHPTTGELVAADSRSRAFPRGMARYLGARDTFCRGPFCDARIRQHDHIAPHAGGGPTTLGNGQGTCVHCNGKERQGVRVERREGPVHAVAWTGRSGVTRVSAPPAIGPPVPD